MSKKRTESKGAPSREQVRADLHLDVAPDDAFMALLQELGDGDVVQRAPSDEGAPAYTADAFREAIVAGTVGELLGEARRAAAATLDEVGARAGVTKARVQQIERSGNLEIMTLVRLAAALGYNVAIQLQPLDRSKPAIARVLEPAA